MKHHARRRWGSGCIDPRFLDLVTSWRWVVSFTPRPVYPWGKSPLYPLERRLGGPQSQFGRRGEENILDPAETRTPTLSLPSWLNTLSHDSQFPDQDSNWALPLTKYWPMALPFEPIFSVSLMDTRSTIQIGHHLWPCSNLCVRSSVAWICLFL
jgi:hypothetical protein